MSIPIDHPLIKTSYRVNKLFNTGSGKLLWHSNLLPMHIFHKEILHLLKSIGEQVKFIRSI